jgi:heme/copper-type cytochrome/quinol oxidase subunit 2
MVRLLSSVGRVAEARLRDAGRRIGMRAVLAAAAALAGLIAAGFAIGAATVALAARLGTIEALLVMAGVALVVMIALLIVISAQARRDREQAALRAELDSRLLRAAAVSMIPTRVPSRPVLGLALVAVGALLVMIRRGGDEKI